MHVPLNEQTIGGISNEHRFFYDRNAIPIIRFSDIVEYELL